MTGFRTGAQFVDVGYPEWGVLTVVRSMKTRVRFHTETKTIVSVVYDGAHARRFLKKHDRRNP